MDKLFSRSCPKCTELYSSFEIAKVSLGAGVQVNMSCENNHKWSEFFSLTYTGFWWSGKMYDSYGNPESINTGGNNDENKV